jgi:protein-S-isoprenylcysteine O-methyltransferase Ste14
MAPVDRDRRQVTVWNHIRAVVLLPGMNTVIIPSLLLWLFADLQLGKVAFAADAAAVCLALPLLVFGISLVSRAIALFVGRGEGTLAPWDPTCVLITGDIYRFSRNPMKAGLFLILIGETLLLRSTALAVWTTCFVLANVLYIRWFEEPGLRRRFGSDYEAYCGSVARWLDLSALRRHKPHRIGHAS